MHATQHHSRLPAAQLVPILKTRHAVIVEDDRPTMARMEALIETHCPAIKIVGSAQTKTSASTLLRRTDFDIAFVDVEIGRSSGIELLRKVGSGRFDVVIVSAHEKYALAALKSSAVDYLLKPVDPVDLVCCYRKLIGQLHAVPEPPPPPDKKIILRQGDQLYIKRAGDIICMTAKGFYTEVCFVHDGSFRSITISKPIQTLESEWHDVDLLRVHRSFLINLKFIVKLQKKGEGLLIRLQQGLEVPVSRKRVPVFLERFHA